MAANGNVESVRAATGELEDAIDREIAAREATEAAARALVIAAEAWISPRFYHPMTGEAAGLLHDVLEYEVPREHVRANIPGFLELVDVAATERTAA